MWKRIVKRVDADEDRDFPDKNLHPSSSEAAVLS